MARPPILDSWTLYRSVSKRARLRQCPRVLSLRRSHQYEIEAFGSLRSASRPDALRLSGVRGLSSSHPRSDRSESSWSPASPSALNLSAAREWHQLSLSNAFAPRAPGGRSGAENVAVCSLLVDPRSGGYRTDECPDETDRRNQNDDKCQRKDHGDGEADAEDDDPHGRLECVTPRLVIRYRLWRPLCGAGCRGVVGHRSAAFHAGGREGAESSSTVGTGLQVSRRVGEMLRHTRRSEIDV